jgi:hypothetical protein
VWLGAAKATVLEGTTAAYSGTASRPLPPEGSIDAPCHSNTRAKPLGVAEEVGAWEGSAGAMEPGAPATPKPPSRLALPTGSDVLGPGKDTVATDSRKRKSVVLKGNNRRNWQRVG